MKPRSTHPHVRYCEFNDIMDSIAALTRMITTGDLPLGYGVVESFEVFDYLNEIGPGVSDIHSPNVPSVERIEARQQRRHSVFRHNACG